MKCDGCGADVGVVIKPINSTSYYCDACADKIEACGYGVPFPATTTNPAPQTETATSPCAPNYYVVMPQDGWHCPRCNAINAPDVKQCPCSPPHMSYSSFAPDDQPSVPPPKLSDFACTPDGRLVSSTKKETTT